MNENEERERKTEREREGREREAVCVCVGSLPPSLPLHASPSRFTVVERDAMHKSERERGKEYGKWKMCSE